MTTNNKGRTKATPLNIYLQWLLRALLIKVYSGEYTPEKSLGFKQSKLYNYLVDKEVPIKVIGSSIKTRFNKFFGQGPLGDVNFGERALDDYIEIFKELCKLKNFRDLYSDWHAFAKEESNYLPEIKEIDPSTSISFSFKNNKKFGYYLEHAPIIATQIEDAVIKRVEKIYSNTALRPAVAENIDIPDLRLPEYAIFYACHQYSPKENTQEFKVSHLQITGKTDKDKWDTGKYISFEFKSDKLESKKARLGKFSQGDSKTFYFNTAHNWDPESQPLFKTDRQTHMIFSSSTGNPEKMGFFAGTFIAKAEDDSPLAGVFIAKKISGIEVTKAYYESLRKGIYSDGELKEITKHLRNKLINVSNASLKEFRDLKSPNKISRIIGLHEKEQVGLDDITKDGGDYICLRTSSDGRFIHIYQLHINQKGIVTSNELDTSSNPLAQLQEVKSFWGIIDSFDENKFSIELGVETRHPFLYMFEKEGEQNEYRGFCLGFEFGNTNKPSATRCLLLSGKQFPELLVSCPLDIEVNSSAFMNLPLNDENKYLPMRLGGEYDNAMRFFDAGENKENGPEIKLGDVFFYAAKGLIEKESPSISDYELSVKYLIKSAEHAYRGNFGNISKRRDDMNSLIKQREDKVELNMKNLKSKLEDGIKFRYSKSNNLNENKIINILKLSFDKNSVAIYSFLSNKN
jgi:hypothetical protein